MHAWCKIKNGEWALGKILSNMEKEFLIGFPEGKVYSTSTFVWFLLNCEN